MKKVCVVCGGEFQGHHNAKSCSLECKKARNVNKASQWRAAHPNWEREHHSKNRQRRNAQRREWRARNNEHARERDKRWYHDNRERELERCRQYRETNRELVNARSKASYWRHREKNLIALRRQNTERTAARQLVREIQSKGLKALL